MCHFGPLLPKPGQKWIFLEKKVLSVFKYSNYLAMVQKIRWPIPEKNTKTTDGRTDGQTDRQQWFYRILPRTGVQNIRIESMFNIWWMYVECIIWQECTISHFYLRHNIKKADLEVENWLYHFLIMVAKKPCTIY